MAIEIVDLPMKHGDFPSFFVCLPEGRNMFFTTYSWLTPWMRTGELFSIVLLGVSPQLRCKMVQKSLQNDWLVVWNHGLL
jgi:hypothetical protein